MRLNRVIVRVSLLALSAFVPILIATPAHALANCELHANNPHISSTPGKGIVAKSTMFCPNRHDSGDININIFKCSSDKQDPDETWVNAHCDPVWSELHHIAPLDYGVLYTRQAPAAGGGELHGKGL